jgi:DNA-binding NarL/FixJ family response regulator
MKTRIFIADDHQIVIDGLKLLLNSNDDFVVVGSATDGLEAIDGITKLTPDVALLDLRMSGKDGIQIIRHLQSIRSKTKCIIMSMHGERRFVIDAKNYGAKGYLLKNAGMNELFDALYKVKNGGQSFNKEMDLNETEQRILTPRELEIVGLIVQEHTTNQIAEILSLETHRKNILRKTGAKNLAGLVKFMLDHSHRID